MPLQVEGIVTSVSVEVTGIKMEASNQSMSFLRVNQEITIFFNVKLTSIIKMKDTVSPIAKG